MSRHAVVLFGMFPKAPAAVRLASQQPTFAYGHAIVAISGSAKPTAPFVGEYAGETDVIAGIRRFTDCVYASLDMGASEMTHGRLPASPATRELLQAAGGTKPTVEDPDQGGNALNAQKAARVLWGLATEAANVSTWAAIRDALGGDEASCWIGEPMAKSQDYQAVRVGDLQPFCASIGPYMHTTITEEGTLKPIISTQLFVAPVHGGIAAGETVHAYDPAVPGAVADSWTNRGAAGTSCIVDAYERVGWEDEAGNPITGPVPHGTFVRIAKGGFPAHPSMEGRLVVKSELSLNPTPIVQTSGDTTPFDQADIDAAVTAQKAADDREARGPRRGPEGRRPEGARPGSPARRPDRRAQAQLRRNPDAPWTHLAGLGGRHCPRPRRGRGHRDHRRDQRLPDRRPAAGLRHSGDRGHRTLARGPGGSHRPRQAASAGGMSYQITISGHVDSAKAEAVVLKQAADLADRLGAEGTFVFGGSHFSVHAGPGEHATAEAREVLADYNARADVDDQVGADEEGEPG